MKRLITAALVLAVSGALAGCGSATDSVDFKVPDGYQSKLNMFGMEIWTKGNDPNQSAILLMKMPVKMDEKNFKMPDLSTAGVKDAKITSSKMTTICGDQPAMVMTVTGTSSKGDTSKQEDLNMVMTSAAGATYMAMYMRPHGEATDTDAANAVNNVCAKK
jgi:hypothetical protein